MHRVVAIREDNRQVEIIAVIPRKGRRTRAVRNLRVRAVGPNPPHPRLPRKVPEGVAKRHKRGPSL